MLLNRLKPKSIFQITLISFTVILTVFWFQNCDGGFKLNTNSSELSNALPGPSSQDDNSKEPKNETTPAPRTQSGGVIFYDSFESGDLSHEENNIKWNGSKAIQRPLEVPSVVTSTSYSGQQSLRFTYAGGGEYAHSEQRFLLGDVYSELYIRWYQFFPDGSEGLGPKWYHPRPNRHTNNKYLRVWGNTPFYEHNDAIMGSGASFYLGDSPGDSDVVLVYFEKKNGRIIKGMGPGDRNGNDIGRWENGINDSLRGQWVEILFHLKAASAADRDGVLELYVDGKVVASNKELAIFPGAGQQNGYTAGYLMGWANSGFTQTTHTYIDDFTISTSPFK